MPRRILLLLILIGIGTVVVLLRKALLKDSRPMQSTTQDVPPEASQAQTSISSAYTIDERHPQEFTAIRSPKRSPRTADLIALASPEAIHVDGYADEAVWAKAAVVNTLDRSSQRSIQLRAVYTQTHLYILATYPDKSENRTHRSYVYHEAEGIYRPANDREDVFVLKWSMDESRAHLDLSLLTPHRADIWYWKAFRTDPQGYADDKIQTLSMTAIENSRIINKGDTGPLYLLRVGDAGRSSYKESIPFEYAGNALPRYTSRPPQGSRADVRAKGVWIEETWTLEFGRALDTTHDDDVIFSTDKTYLFGVSCYEVAGGKVEPDWHQPLYKTGDIFDRITLRFAERE